MLFIELKHQPITSEMITLTKHIDEITCYFNHVNEIHQEISRNIPNEALPYICLAWKNHHFSYRKKSKQINQENYQFFLDCALPLLNIDDEKEKFQKNNEIFEQLNSIVRSSSLVETINSQIRPFLNSCKGQITQETLILIIFYHNHRAYKTGKRKNIGPIELLTDTKLDKHWVEFLLDAIN